MKNRASSGTRKNATILETAFAVRKAVFLMDKAVDRALAEAGRSTLSRLMLFSIVQAHPCITQRELAGLLDLTEAAVSRQVEHLMKKKLLARKKIPDTRRAMALTLTPAGEKELTDSMLAGHSTMIELYKCVADDDLATVRQVFERIGESMKVECEARVSKIC